MIRPLPPYSDVSTCPKCGHNSVTTLYRDVCRYWPRPPDDPREHLLRTCERCGYSWAEAPIDQKLKGRLARRLIKLRAPDEDEE